MAPVDPAPLLEWGVALKPLAAETRCGDVHVVIDLPGRALAAVIDGLGHGDDAALAAERAARVVSRNRRESPVSLVRLCHEALKNTRGVAMAVAVFDGPGGTMTWIGVGDVFGVLLRAQDRTPRTETLLQRSGVVGLALPALQESVLRVGPGDVLILATDGVRTDFAAGLKPLGPAPRLAERILASHGKDTDDKLVLVARYQRE
jgi:hypothetical protein